MRRELPKLDFVYVDTYWEHGWPAWKIAAKLKQSGPADVHRRRHAARPLDHLVALARQGSAVMRFLWYSDRDIFNNDALLRGGRSDDDGFMGWQNSAQLPQLPPSPRSRAICRRSISSISNCCAGNRARRPIFSDGVKVVKNGDAVTVTQNGRTVMTWTGGGSNSRLFVPWDAGRRGQDLRLGRSGNRADVGTPAHMAEARRGLPVQANRHGPHGRDAAPGRKTAG